MIKRVVTVAEELAIKGAAVESGVVFAGNALDEWAR